jgi:hypothetical protein
MVAWRSSLVVFGGQDGEDGSLNDLFILDTGRFSAFLAYVSFIGIRLTSMSKRSADLLSFSCSPESVLGLKE